MVVIVRCLVRCRREVVRSIALMVHHIQATHSDAEERLGKASRKRERVSERKRERETRARNRGRLSPRLQTGCILQLIDASIYDQTHTMAMPSSLHTHNATPAVSSTSTTRGREMDQNG